MDNDASIDMSYGKENSQGNFVVKSLAEDMPELLDDDEDEDEEADNESSASKFSFDFKEHCWRQNNDPR